VEPSFFARIPVTPLTFTVVVSGKGYILGIRFGEDYAFHLKHERRQRNLEVPSVKGGVVKSAKVLALSAAVLGAIVVNTYGSLTASSGSTTAVETLKVSIREWDVPTPKARPA